jgi:hypothetical protein
MASWSSSKAFLTEHWRVGFRRTYFTRLAQVERTQQYLRFYNTERTHRGYRGIRTG